MTTCPDHEALAGFMERRLAEPQQSEIERHVAGCVSCLDVLAAAAIPAETLPQTPVTPMVPVRATATVPARSWVPALAAGLALLVTGGVGYRAMGVASEQVRVTAIRMATDRFGESVDVEQLGFKLGPGLGQITVKAQRLDLGALGNVAAAEVVLAPRRLGVGRSDVRALRLFAPAFRWTLAEEDPARVTPGAALGALALAPTVEIVGGVLRIDQSNGPAIIIEDLSVATQTIGGQVHLRATATLADGTLSVRGTLDAEASRVDLTIGGHDLPSAILPYVRDWADGLTALAVRVTGGNDTWRWAGRLAVADARMPGLDLAGDLAESLRIAPGALSAPDAGLADLRATFRLDERGWRVPRGVVVQGALETRARLRGAPGGSVTGEGIAFLPSAVSRALIARRSLAGVHHTTNGRLEIPIRLHGEAGRMTVVRSH